MKIDPRSNQCIFKSTSLSKSCH